MADFVDQLLAHKEITRGGQSSGNGIEALVGRFGATFPESLLKLWTAADGLRFDAIDAEIPGATEVLRLVESVWPGEFLERGFVPLLDDHQSNWLVIIVKAPLAYRVSHVPHDDGSRLLYRDLNGFAKALLRALDVGRDADAFFHETDGDYRADTRRPQSDQDAARALMDTDGKREEWNYATQLLDESNLSEFAKLLETDHFVRRDVIRRMRQMHLPAIQDLLNRDRISFDGFAGDLAEAARKAGLEVGERREGVLRVGATWINLDAFYHRRNIPNAMPRMIAWIEDLIAGRNPHHRAGNFHVD